jgi:hypothetical protein
MEGSELMAKLSSDFRCELRLFAFFLGNRSLESELLNSEDFRDLFEDASALEQTFAIFANVIEMDDEGRVPNAEWAFHRAAQYIWSWSRTDEMTVVEPPFEEWELELHGP